MRAAQKDVHAGAERDDSRKARKGAKVHASACFKKRDKTTEIREVGEAAARLLFRHERKIQEATLILEFHQALRRSASLISLISVVQLFLKHASACILELALRASGSRVQARDDGCVGLIQSRCSFYSEWLSSLRPKSSGCLQALPPVIPGLTRNPSSILKSR